MIEEINTSLQQILTQQYPTMDAKRSAICLATSQIGYVTDSNFNGINCENIEFENTCYRIIELYRKMKREINEIGSSKHLLKKTTNDDELEQTVFSLTNHCIEFKGI